MSNSVEWRARQNKNGSWTGMVSFVPTRDIGKFKKGKRFKLKSDGASKASALGKASKVASMITNNPILSAALPPGTPQAIKAISYLSKNAAAGKLKSAAKKIAGKGAKRLFKALSFW